MLLFSNNSNDTYEQNLLLCSSTLVICLIIYRLSRAFNALEASFYITAHSALTNVLLKALINICKPDLRPCLDHL